MVMLPSYNHDVAYRGHTFHVQTEASHTSPATLTTHLFLAGDIIATQRHTQAPTGADDPSGNALKAAMQAQHKNAMRALISGAHDSTLQARGVALAPGS